MKKIVMLIIVAFFILGCSQKSSVLTLSNYQSQSSQKFSGANVYIGEIKDSRTNQSVIATITDSKGSVDEYVTLQNNLVQWFRTALTKELTSLGANVIADRAGANLVVDINIAQLVANLSGYSSENTSAKAELFLKIYKGDTTYTKRVAQSQSKFSPVITGGAFTPFVEDMLKDVVKKSAEQILNSL